MSESGSKKQGCLKRGCLGCGAVLLLGVVSLLVLAIAGRFFAPDVEPGVASLAPELPLLDSLAALPPGPPPEDEGATPISTQRRGTLALDLEEGTFELVPAPAGSGLRVEAEYDKGAYELLEVREWTDEGDWTYRIVFRNTIGILGLFRGGGVNNRVVVHVPADLPLNLEAKLRRGESKIDLGSLDLERIDLDVMQGAHDIRVSAPTAAPVAEFSLKSRMGALSISSLGNASPARADLDVKMGALEFDLSGAWVTESTIQVLLAMGGGNITAPLDVPLVIDRAHSDAGEVTVFLPEGRAEEASSFDKPVRLSLDGALNGLTVTQR